MLGIKSVIIGEPGRVTSVNPVAGTSFRTVLAPQLAQCKTKLMSMIMLMKTGL